MGKGDLFNGERGAYLVGEGAYLVREGAYLVGGRVYLVEKGGPI